ncbi:MAG: cytochrome c3 family protein, partial [Halioglobus sp.]
SCQDCHTPEDWSGKIFEHGETEFPLLGNHQEVRCNACHADNKYEETPTQCNSCHAINDVHEGVNGNQCDSCHSEKGWDEVSFDHNVDTEFALNGGHKTLACNACHEQSAVERKLATACVECHREDDEHSGGNGDSCDACHSEDRWGLNRFDHSSTEFALTGKHKSTSCESCHRGGTEIKIGSACIDCHKPDDVHAGQQGVECDACHNSLGWLDEVRFSHDLTAFPLVGIHAVTSCDSCHATSEFRAVESQCVDCHLEDDVHSAGLGPGCHSCHNPNDWQLWVFDHDVQSSFSLDGEHEGLACNECHFKATKTVVKQSAQCGTCHLKDDVHNKSFGRACERCHTTTSFENVRMQ